MRVLEKAEQYENKSKFETVIEEEEGNILKNA